ncbi:hypothetical protein COLO4_33041 [Corchorus olitorius]|uniref:Uncharacterized protein n=1 Tax=Corchorus olitorius TaxID=93759 RepID=A0A1R3GWM0_9ROSI|nr:hypothetical protein COLO4_33041 [Corchorus olitorius]
MAESIMQTIPGGLIISLPWLNIALCLGTSEEYYDLGFAWDFGRDLGPWLWCWMAIYT